MAMVTDPVCGMRIDDDDAAATAEHDGVTYYFCSQACHDAFVADPASALDDLRRRSSSPSVAARRPSVSGVGRPRHRAARGRHVFRRRDVMVVRVVETLDAKGIDAGSVAVAPLRRSHARLPRERRAAASTVRHDVRAARREHRHRRRDARTHLRRVRASRSGTRRARPLGGSSRCCGCCPCSSRRGARGRGLRLARVWGDAARKVAQYLTHYMHHAIEEQYRRRGLRDNEAFEAALAEVGRAWGRRGHALLAVPTPLRDVHDRASVRARRDGARAGGVRVRPAKTVGAIVFADLTVHATHGGGGRRAAAAISVELAAS